jgi:hypothetical protein
MLHMLTCTIFSLLYLNELLSISKIFALISNMVNNNRHDLHKQKLFSDLQ